MIRYNRLQTEWKSNDALIMYHRSRFNKLDPEDERIIIRGILVLSMENSDRYILRELIKTANEETTMHASIFPYYIIAFWKLKDYNTAHDLFHNNRALAYIGLKAEKYNERRIYIHKVYTKMDSWKK